MEDDYAANKKAYDTLAGKWSQKYFKADVKRSTDLFVKYLKPGSKVLDIGCCLRLSFRKSFFKPIFYKGKYLLSQSS